MRTHAFLPSTKKTSSTTLWRQYRSRIQARRKSQSAKMRYPPRTNGRKPWDIKANQEARNSVKDNQPQITRIFTIFLRSEQRYTNSSAKTGRGNEVAGMRPISIGRPKRRVSGSERVKHPQHIRIPDFFLFSCFPDSLSS